MKLPNPFKGWEPGKWFDELSERQRLFRRIVLIWAMALVTFVVDVVMDVDVLLSLTTEATTVVISLIGILTTVIGFYQWHRAQDDKLSQKSDSDGDSE